MIPKGLKNAEIKNTFSLLNDQIFENTNGRFDLGNFVQIKRISARKANVEMKSNMLMAAKCAIDDDTRRKIEAIIKTLPVSGDNTAKKSLEELLVRKILYLGSECERLGAINIEEEYKELEQQFESEFMVLKRVPKPTIKALLDEWAKVEPSVIFFSCHGDTLGFFLKDENGDCTHYASTKFFDFFRKRVLHTECVILSACESLAIGEKIKNWSKNVVCINKKVNIQTAKEFTKIFMKYLNDHSLHLSSIYKDAFNHAKDSVFYEDMDDAFSFILLESDLIN